MRTPVHVDVWYSADWHDITSDVRSTPEHQITISGGNQNWLTRVSPTKCDLALINTIIHPGDDPSKIGKYSPRNPLSPLYGLIGRNTPLRVYVRWLADDFARTVASGWGTSASHLDSSNKETAIVGSLAWTTTGSGTGSAAVGSGVATHTQTTANGFRLSYLAAGSNIRDCEIRCVVTADEADIDGGNIEPGNLVLRLQDSSNYYHARVQVTTGEAVQIGIRKVVAGVGSEVVAPVTVDGLTYTGQQLAVAFLADGPHLAAKVWDPAVGEAFAWQVTATDTSLPARGAPGVRSGVATGNTDVPVTFTYDNVEVRNYRFTGEVEAWPQEWTLDADEDGNGVLWAPLVAYGLMQRLGLPGQDVLAQSSLRRFIDRAATPPVGFWPMDTPANVVPNGAAMVVMAVDSGGAVEQEWRSTTVVPWLESGASLSPLLFITPTAALAETASATIDVIAYARPVAAGSGSWGLMVVDSAEATVCLTFASWVAGVPTLSLFGSGGPALDTATASDAAKAWDNAAHHWRVTVEQDGADINITVYIDGVEVMSGTDTTATLATIKPLLFTNDGVEGAAGYVVQWSGTPPSVTDAALAAQGHAGETADERVGRVCAEEDIQAFVFGDGQSMGPQLTAPPLELFIGSGEVKDVDAGVFGEPRHTLGFSFTAYDSLLNQDPTLTLDYASNEVAPPLLHREDLDHCQNDVIVTRRGGASSARFVQETGPLNVSEPHTDPNGVGHFPVRPELNLASDAQTDIIAGRLRWHGTTDGLRFAALGVDLTALYHASKTGLIGDVLAVDPGDKVTVENIPTWLGAGDTEQIQRGFTELLGQFHWVIEHVTSPGEVFQVGEYAANDADAGDEPVSRYDTAGCQTAPGLWVPATAGAFASTPDAAALDVTGDLDLRADITPASWLPSATQTIIAKGTTTGDQRSYWLELLTTGQLRLNWSTDGTSAGSLTATSTASVPLDLDRRAVRATIDVNDGGGNRVINFYTGVATGGLNTSDVTYVQLGSTVTTAGTTSIFASTGPLQVGERASGLGAFEGIIHAAQVRNGINFTIVAYPRFDQEATGTTSFSDGFGRTWTVNGTAAIFHDFISGTDTRLLVYTTKGQPWTTDSDDLPMDLKVSGVVLQVTGVVGTGKTQRLTVTQTPVNGVAKTIEPNESVSLARPAYYAP